MKRNKIKNKYLQELQKRKLPQEKSTIFDQLERSIFKFLITCGWILLLLLWGIVPIIILTLLGINYKNLSDLARVLISFVNDLLLLSIFFGAYHNTIKKDFQDFFHKNVWKKIGLSFRYWLIGIIIMLISNSIISIITNGQLAANEESVRELINIFPIYMAFQLIIYAPCTEELIFRKSIRDIFSNKYLFIFFSGFIFGGLHVFPSLQSIQDLLYLIPYCSLGFVFASLYNKTNNIFSTITAHAFHNSLALLLYLVTVIS